jgi:AraC-like DNA-binding protein
VDLTGRLSIPPRTVRSLSVQGSRRSNRFDQEPETGDSGLIDGPQGGARNQRGRLSNPVQRRLADTDVDDLVAGDQNGSTIDVLAREFDVHRTTVMDHLDRRGVLRRTPRRLTDEMVNLATRRYMRGETIDNTAEHLHVSATTLARELRLAGTSIRPRGRPTAN